MKLPTENSWSGSKKTGLGEVAQPTDGYLTLNNQLYLAVYENPELTS